MEILVRIALVKYFETKGCNTSVEALGKHLSQLNILLDKLIIDNLYKQTPELLENGAEFREKELYTYDANEILSFNENMIRKIFKLYLHPNKQYITNKECV
jgi:hypothetical protein